MNVFYESAINGGRFTHSRTKEADDAGQRLHALHNGPLFIDLLSVPSSGILWLTGTLNPSAVSFSTPQAVEANNTLSTTKATIITQDCEDGNNPSLVKNSSLNSQFIISPSLYSFQCASCLSVSVTKPDLNHTKR